MKLLKLLSFVVIFVLFSVSVKSAVPPLSNEIIITTGEKYLTITSNIPPLVKYNEDRVWNIQVINDSAILTGDVTCVLTISLENTQGNIVYYNATPSLVGSNIQFSIPAAVHEVKGIYSAKTLCNTSSQAGLLEYYYTANGSGTYVAGDILTLLIYLLFIAMVFFAVWCIFMILLKFVHASFTVKNVLYCFGVILLNLLLIHLSDYYMVDTFVFDISSWVLDVSVWTHGVLPVICFIWSIFIEGFRRKRVPDEQKLWG